MEENIVIDGTVEEVEPNAIYDYYELIEEVQEFHTFYDQRSKDTLNGILCVCFLLSILIGLIFVRILFKRG